MFVPFCMRVTVPADSQPIKFNVALAMNITRKVIGWRDAFCPESVFYDMTNIPFRKLEYHRLEEFLNRETMYRGVSHDGLQNCWLSSKPHAEGELFHLTYRTRLRAPTDIRDSVCSLPFPPAAFQRPTMCAFGAPTNIRDNVCSLAYVSEHTLCPTPSLPEDASAPVHRFLKTPLPHLIAPLRHFRPIPSLPEGASAPSHRYLRAPLLYSIATRTH